MVTVEKRDDELKKQKNKKQKQLADRQMRELGNEMKESLKQGNKKK